MNNILHVHYSNVTETLRSTTNESKIHILTRKIEIKRLIE